ARRRQEGDRALWVHDPHVRKRQRARRARPRLHLHGGRVGDGDARPPRPARRRRAARDGAARGAGRAGRPLLGRGADGRGAPDLRPTGWHVGCCTLAAMRARTGILIYGLACYAVFLVVLAYAVGFIGNLWRSFGWTSLPSMDLGGPPAPLGEAVLVDALLLALFAVQHSVMARPGFKRWWTRIVPAPAERSSYVLASSLLLALLFWRWRPIATTLVWSATSGPAPAALV